MGASTRVTAVHCLNLPSAVCSMETMGPRSRSAFASSGVDSTLTRSRAGAIMAGTYSKPSRQAQPLQLLEQPLPRQPQRLGGVGAVVLEALQRGLDLLALERLDLDPERCAAAG